MDESLPVAGTVVLLRDGSAGLEVLLVRRPDRGSFAGGWVFPGGKVEDADRVDGADEIEDARLAGIRETSEEVGLAVDGLVVLSRWNPPPEAPARIRTWFFLAHDPGGTITPSPDEVIDTIWMRPAEAMERHAMGALTLFPPTWVTLFHLAGFSDVASAFAAAGEPPTFTTRMRRSAAETTLLWQGDAEHPSAATPAGIHRLEIGALPWRYTRS